MAQTETHELREAVAHELQTGIPIYLIRQC